jgi:hypothetical protein
MDKTIVDRAVRALAALNACRGSESRTFPAQVRPLGTEAESNGAQLGACGSRHCAGCYEVAPGVRIHPPRCGEDYKAWLEGWEARGRLQ